MPCGSASARPEPARSEAWPAPLDRRISVHIRDLPLRDALDRVAAAAHLRFSYNDELLPLDRPVCQSFTDVALGDVLTELLRGARVTPVAAATDHVILAPASAAVADEPAPAPVVTLDRIVVTGSASGAPQRGLPVALSVVGRRALDSDPAGTMSQLMDGSVAGLWLWEQSPGSVVASYGSVRGASSFGLTSPKIYLDGIQIANPLLFTQIAPEGIERIEVIRGPQGTALYGADALSGVVNIVTRREHLEAGTPRMHFQSSLGMAQSSFVPGGTTMQQHALSLRTGSDLRSAGLDVAVGGIGAFMPGAYDRHLTASGSARFVGARTILTATGRLFAQQAGVAMSPVLRDSLGGVVALDTTHRAMPAFSLVDSTPNPQSVREYTLGGSATWAPDGRWTHSAVFGLDGYKLTGVLQELTPIPSAADSALNAARGAADRGTLRLSSVARFGDGQQVAGSLTFAAEQSVLRESTAAHDEGPLDRHAPSTLDEPEVQWQQTSAGVAQGQMSLFGSLFLTGGLRAERDAGLATSQSALLPMLGGSLVREFGATTVKLRAAYGRGIRPAQTPARETMWTGIREEITRPGLQPERQSGVEAGLDVVVGGRVTFQLTRYDQSATGLIQRVPYAEQTQMQGPTQGQGALFPPPHWGTDGPRWGMPGDSGDSHGGHMENDWHLAYGLQNVGAIRNRGWELQTTADLGPLALTGNLAYTDSRVSSLAGGYSGDLRPGDRVLGVPRWTGSIAASVKQGPWSASATAYRASDWIGYDRLALTRDFLQSTQNPWGFVGTSLRSYWQQYTGVTHLRATASRALPHGFTLLLTGDNLLNQQLGEPDNITVLPGRSFTFGVRANF